MTTHWKHPTIGIHEGDQIEGDEIASAEDIAAYEEAKLGTPIEKIRKAEAAADDKLKRASRLASLEVARNKARAIPSAAPLFVGKSEAEIYTIVHEWCYAADGDYHELWDLEQFCTAQRKLM